MEKIWIIGAGHFGLLALKRLSASRKDRHFTLVDPARKALDSLSSERVDTEQADGVTFLAHHLRQQDAPDWIIPALPVHLAAEWCLARSGPERLRRISLPPETDLLLPNPMRGESGDVYVSHATFLCPDDCPEPRNICTVTQQPRKQNMSDLLGGVSLPGFDALVIQSRQLGPGVGGYRPASLFRLLSQVEKSEKNLLMSTACRCHGVITGLKPADLRGF